MNSKNIIIGILLLTTVGFGIYGLGIQQSRVNDRDATIAKLTKAASSRGSSKRSGGDSQQRSADSKKSSSGKSQAPDDQRSQMPGGSAIRNLMQSPKAAPLLASQQRAMIENRYAPLFKALNLTPEQLSKFKDLLVEKQNAARDVMTVAREQGMDMRNANDRAEIQQLIQQSQADVDNSIAAAIGSDKLAQYQNYDQTAPQRAVVSQVEQRLSYTSEPLSAAQSNQLVALLAQNTPPPDNSGGNRVFAFSMGGMGPMTITQGVPITNQVLESAQTFLSPGQVDALRQMQAEQADQQQLQKMLMNGGGGGGGSNSKSKSRHSRGDGN